MGDHLKWTAYDGLDYPGVNFMFQDEKCCMIYHDRPGELTSALEAELRSLFGSSRNAYFSEGKCYYTAYTETYMDTGDKYLRQQYKAASMRD